MRLRGWLVVLCVVTLVALTTLVVTDLQREWQQRIDEAERHLTALTRTLHEHAEQTFHTADILLLNAVGIAERGLPVGGLSDQITPALVRNVNLVPQVTAMVIIDENGLVRADSRPDGVAGKDVSSCSCYVALRDGLAEGVQLDFTDIFETDVNTISLSRRISWPDGRFAGVGITLVDASYLESFYATTRVGNRGIIALIGSDGQMLAQSPRGSFNPGESVAGHPVFEHFRAGDTTGLYHTMDPAVDFVSLVAWHHFSEFPLILSVAADRGEILAGWDSRRFISIIVLMGISFAVFLLASYLWVQMGRNQRTSDELKIQKSYFEQLFEGSPEGVVILDNADRVVDANHAFQELFGYSVEELRGRQLNELILPDGLFAEATALSQQVLDAQAVHAETVRRRKDGSLIHVSILGVPVTLHDDQVGVYGIYRDISKRIASERELRENEERYRIVAEQTGQVVYDYDVLSGRINWSGAIRKVTGFDDEEFQRIDIDEWAQMLHPDDREQALALLEAARKAGSGYHAEYRMKNKHGGWTVIEDNGAFMRDEEGVAHRMLGTLSDITERKRISSEMAWQASHDALTGLVNRHEFEERVARLLFNRRGRRRHALLYIDLDQFKVVNDTCGHQAGDQLLRQLTALLAISVRESDTLARLGGDEFGLLLVDCPLDQAVAVAEKLIVTVNDFRFSWDDQTFNIGTSIGLVEITPETDSVAVLFSAADSACYAAKDKGRNQVVIFREGDAELAARHGEMTWVSRITKALEEDRFVLHWQPIKRVAAADDGYRRFELLLRMVGEDGELISPAQFILAAERYNLMPQVDRWVVRDAFRQLSGSEDDKLMISINLSGTTLSSDRFIAFVHEEIQRTGVDPEAICYEITETAAIGNLERAQQFIEEMHNIGCRISLDDFGSGLSSFAYLKSLKVDFIKIDGAFVKDVADDQADKAMVEAIIRVGQVMGILTVAEFVESEAILQALTEMGVDYAQGYHIGRPEPQGR